MAVVALNNQFISFDGTDLSTWLIGATVTDRKISIEDNRMAMTATNSIVGTDDWEIKAKFAADFAGSASVQVLRAKLGVNTIVVVRPTSAVASATNPQWTGTGKFFEIASLPAEINTRPEFEITIKPAGSSITYALA